METTVEHSSPKTVSTQSPTLPPVPQRMRPDLFISREMDIWHVISELNLERQKLLAKVLAPVTDRLLSVLQLPSGARGLDLGCGMGETTRQLARTLDKPNEIVGLELNPDLVETAKKLSSGEQDDVSFEQGDVSALEFVTTVSILFSHVTC